MGEAEIIPQLNQIIIHSTLFFYGGAVDDALAAQVAKDIADHWNEPQATVNIRNNTYRVLFDMEGIWSKSLLPEMVFDNNNPRNNYFRIETYAMGNISFVDGLPSNTGYFKLENLLNNSTTAAHEFGHTLGLPHPDLLDIRGKGQPGIMYPRGTICDPEFHYDPSVAPGEKGGTLNPFTRKVLQSDIDLLQLNQLHFNNGMAVIGDFSSVYHENHQDNT
ncbi:MAG: peptidase M10 [Chitinophagaceae bacterium]